MPPPDNADPVCTSGSGPARAQRSRRQLGTRRIIRFAVLGTVLLVSLSPIVASQRTPSPASLSFGNSAVETGPQVVSTFGSTVPTNLSYCGLLGPNPGTSANLPDYVQNVSILWNMTCVLPSFIEAINEWGNLYLAYTGGSNNSTYWASGNLSVETLFNGTQVPEVAFGVFYSAPCTNGTRGAGFDCPYETYWFGNLSTNRLAGPYTYERNCPGCSLPGGESLVPLASPGFPYGLVLGFSLAGALAVGVVVAARRRG